MLPSFSRFFALSFSESFWNLQNLAKMRAKMKYICKKFINHQTRNVCYFAVVMHAVVIMQILNWTNQCSLFMTVRYILRSVRMPTHGWSHTRGRDHWWTLYRLRYKCFPFPGVNSRAELVPSHGATSRWLGDKRQVKLILMTKQNSVLMNK